MEILLLYLLALVLGLILLIKSSDYFVESASETGKKLGISEIVIGLVIVSIGTSLPELATSITSLFNSESYAEFVLGNIIGSNIANILLVLGFLIFLTHGQIQRNIDKIEIITIVILSLILIGFISIGRMNFIVGFIFIITYICYIYYKLKTNQIDESIPRPKTKYSILIPKLILSGAFIFLSSKLVVFCVEYIAKFLSIPQSFVTLTVVALGTSLPELFVTFSSIKQNKIGLGVGNILGSNIANIALIIGLGTIIKPFVFSVGEFYLGILFLIISTIMLNLILIKKPTKRIGLMFLLTYAIYILVYFLFTF